MTEGQFRVEMEAMAQTPGLGGCPLVEVDSGMVLYAAGSDTNTHNIAEASVGFWRLSQRLDAYTESLGPLHAQSLVHSRGQVIIMPCGGRALMVALVRARNSIDWVDWKQRVSALGDLVDSL